MTTVAFKLRVPADPRFQALAPDLAGRFMEMMGGAEADRASLATALADAVRGLAADPHADVDLDFHAGPSGLEVTVRSGGRSSVVRHPLPAPKR